jgi:hypothetical protein
VVAVVAAVAVAVAVAVAAAVAVTAAVTAAHHETACRPVHAGHRQHCTATHLTTSS